MGAELEPWENEGLFWVSVLLAIALFTGWVLLGRYFV